MSYFQYTGQDLAKQRAAGIVEAREEMGEMILALADDTARKLDDENADRQLLLEDLLSRLTELGLNAAPAVRGTFRAAEDSIRRPTYPLLIESELNGEESNVVDLSQAIRETWAAQTFNGIPRHEHVGLPDDRCHRSFEGRRCNQFWGHDSHKTEYEEKGN